MTLPTVPAVYVGGSAPTSVATVAAASALGWPRAQAPSFAQAAMEARDAGAMHAIVTAIYVPTVPNGAATNPSHVESVAAAAAAVAAVAPPPAPTEYAEVRSFAAGGVHLAHKPHSARTG